MSFDNHFDHIQACLMIDTLGLRIPGADPSRLPNNYVLVGGGDSSRWGSGSLKTAAGKNSLQVRGIKSRHEVRIEGSPGMLRQGHNVVTSGDAKMLAYVAAKDVNRNLDLGLPLERGLQIVQGESIEVTRIDTPVLLNCPAGLTKAAVINGLALAGVLAGHNTSVYVGETVYFDQHSQERAMKVYDKEAEMNSRRLLEIPETDATPMLRDLAKRTLRLEPVYRQKWLQRHIEKDGDLLTPAMLGPEVLAGMLVELLEKYDLRRDLRRPLNEEQLMGIPRKYRQWVLAWQAGYDAPALAEADEFERARVHSYLKANHHIDINAPRPQEIEDRIELGDLLSPSNFVPVPEVIRRDQRLFFSCDLDLMKQDIESRIANH